LNAGLRPEALLELHEDNARHLRHPEIGRPYFYEFFPLAARIGETFHTAFSYQDYFCNAGPGSEALCRYLRGLADGAHGRPIFQECRSTGRVLAIKECLGGTHVLLWRNPWDQWWSYKVDSHFEICNLQILAASQAPPAFFELREILGFNPAGNDVQSLLGQRLDASGSYTLFYALWCHAMLEAWPRCDLNINIDSLSRDEEYRNRLLKQLESHSITGLDFSDCSIPVGYYGKDDRAFFAEIEQRVHELFLCHGYHAADFERIGRLRIEHDCCGIAGNLAPAIAEREFDRLRKLVRRLESELAGTQRQQGILTTNLNAVEAERAAVEKALWVKEAERAAVEKALWVKEAALMQIMTSRYWRWGTPIRLLGSRIKNIMKK